MITSDVTVQARDVRDIRFSKRKLIEHLERRLATMQHQHNFYPYKGWSQVHGFGEEKNRAYGSYSELNDLLFLVRGGLRPDSPRTEPSENLCCICGKKACKGHRP